MSMGMENSTVRSKLMRHIFSRFLCNECNDHVRGGVITICGHLYCWTCLWPNLAGRCCPQCPHCGLRLILHEDIFPFLSEGPHPPPDPVIAQPGGVPRPTGMYLKKRQLPNWFTLHENESASGSHRVLSLIVYSMHRNFPYLMNFKSFLEWFELICVLLMVIVCAYTYVVYFTIDH